MAIILLHAKNDIFQIIVPYSDILKVTSHTLSFKGDIEVSSFLARQYQNEQGEKAFQTVQVLGGTSCPRIE